MKASSQQEGASDGFLLVETKVRQFQVANNCFVSLHCSPGSSGKINQINKSNCFLEKRQCTNHKIWDYAFIKVYESSK